MTLVTRHRNVVLNIGIVVTSLTIASLGLANPTNPSVIAGQATISGLGTSAVTIQQATQQAIINWQHFNIAPNEVTRFIQPNVSAIALNRIFDQNPSQILGSLQANGNVILLNPNGILFGPNAQVNVERRTVDMSSRSPLQERKSYCTESPMEHWSLRLHSYCSVCIAQRIDL